MNPIQLHRQLEAHGYKTIFERADFGNEKAIRITLDEAPTQYINEDLKKIGDICLSIDGRFFFAANDTIKHNVTMVYHL